MTSEEVIEVCDVKLAVQRLCELGERMRIVDFSFKDRDVEHIDEIINAMQELELLRLRSHEVLETESIKTSALRYKLVKFPDEINQEIQDAINAARGLNEETSGSLRAHLEATIAEIEEMERTAERLEQENAQLIPQKETIGLEYEEVIARLNTRLANKANKQIDLNDLRDSVRGCNTKIVEMEEDMVQLKEDLVRERAETREEKKRLTGETDETNRKFNIQAGKNAELEKTLDIVKHDVAETKAAVHDLKSVIRNLETEIKELDAHEKKVTAQIERETMMNAELTQKGNDAEISLSLSAAGINIKAMTERAKEEFKEAILKIGEKITEFEASIETENDRSGGVKEKRDALAEELSKALKIGDEEALKLKKLNATLQQAKADLSLKAQDVGRLQMEMGEMEDRIVDISETHETTVAILKQQIEDLKEQLNRERGERLEVQKEKDTLQKEIDDFRATNAKFMKELNKRINEGKDEHAKLTAERTQLNKSIKDDTQTVARLEVEVVEAQASLDKMRADLTGKLEQMRKEKREMEAGIENRTAELEIKGPQFKEFEEYFNKKIVDFDVLKKKLVALKNRKSGLEDSTTRAKRDIEKQKGPLAELREELTRKQEQAKEQLQSHAQERTEIEKEIYATGCKLKTTKEENARLTKGIADLEREISTIRRNWENALRAKGRMRQEIAHQKDMLKTGWTDDADVETEFAGRDLELVDLLNDLLSQTAERQRCVGNVTNCLDKELRSLSDFLDTISNHRRKAKNPKQLGRLGKLVKKIQIINAAAKPSPQKKA